MPGLEKRANVAKRTHVVLLRDDVQQPRGDPHPGGQGPQHRQVGEEGGGAGQGGGARQRSLLAAPRVAAVRPGAVGGAAAERGQAERGQEGGGGAVAQDEDADVVGQVRGGVRADDAIAVRGGVEGGGLQKKR